MPWTATVTLDLDKPDVGTATAVWNQGLADQFTYSDRMKVSTASKTAFVAAAKAALIAQQAQAASEATYAALLVTALNA